MLRQKIIALALTCALCLGLATSAFAGRAFAVDQVVADQETTGQAQPTSITDQPQSTPTVIDSGMCGSQLYWSVDNTDALTISGEGSMDPYYYSIIDPAPWHQYASQVRTVNVESGVQSIGDFAFADFEATQSITLPDGVKNIGYRAFDCTDLQALYLPSSIEYIVYGAFSGWTDIKDIYYGGSEEDWANIHVVCFAIRETEPTINDCFAEATVIHFNSDKIPDDYASDITSTTTSAGPPADIFHPPKCFTHQNTV